MLGQGPGVHIADLHPRAGREAIVEQTTYDAIQPGGNGLVVHVGHDVTLPDTVTNGTHASEDAHYRSVLAGSAKTIEPWTYGRRVKATGSPCTVIGSEFPHLDKFLLMLNMYLDGSDVSKYSSRQKDLS